MTAAPTRPPASAPTVCGASASSGSARSKALPRGERSPLGRALDRADPLDALAPQTVGADAGGLVGAAVIDANGLQVGQPPPLGLVHRVADVVPGHRSLAADIASLGHNRRHCIRTDLAGQGSRRPPARFPAAGRSPPRQEREERSMAVTQLDGRAFEKFIAAGTYFLRKYRGVLDDLNVFPVPDGDTGSNMFLTAKAALAEARKVRSRELSAVAAAAAHGSLLGARGNSGVILSQMLRGFAHSVRHRPAIDTFQLALGLSEADAAARSALPEPVEVSVLAGAVSAADEA